MAKLIKNLNQEIKDLDGVVVINQDKLPITVGKLVARGLSEANSEDAVRAYMVAQKIHAADGEITLEDADYKMTTEVIQKAKWANFIKAIVIKVVIDDARDVEIKSLKN